jgi:phosphoheptose isomerase
MKSMISLPNWTIQKETIMNRFKRKRSGLGTVSISTRVSVLAISFQERKGV